MIGIGIGIGLSRGYGGPRASLALDFIAQNYRPSGFGSGMTFTRAGTATYIDATGAMQVAAADQPRLNHDPVTLAPLGILIEGPRTNLLPHSGTMTGWGPLNATLSAGTKPAPIPAQTMMRLIETATANNHQISAVATLAAGAHTFSAYFAADGRTQIGYTFTGASLGTLVLTADMTTGIASILSGTGSARMVNCGGGIWRICITFIAAASETITMRVRLRDAAGSDSYVGDGVSGVHLWGAQLDAGDHQTSYIPTAAAPVTRAADSLQVALGAWWPGAASGAIMAEYDCPPVAQLGLITYFSSTAFHNSIGLAKANAMNNGSGTHLVGSMYDTATALSVPLDLGLTSGPHRAAMSWGGGAMQAVANGVAGPEVAQRSPTPTKLWLGQRDGGVFALNGHLRRVLYYPRRLTAAQMQTLTT